MDIRIIYIFKHISYVSRHPKTYIILWIRQIVGRVHLHSRLIAIHSQLAPRFRVDDPIWKRTFENLFNILLNIAIYVFLRIYLRSDKIESLIFLVHAIIVVQASSRHRRYHVDRKPGLAQIIRCSRDILQLAGGNLLVVGYGNCVGVDFEQMLVEFGTATVLNLTNT